MQLERADDGLTLQLDRDEVTVLARLLDEMEEVLRAEGRDDPVRARLFPDAYDDAEAQTSYRELVGNQLLDEKVAVLRRVREQLSRDQIAISGDDVDAWLVALTDLRLALGTRLGVTEDLMGDDIDPDSPDAPAMTVLYWLGWVQESMLSHLSV